MRESATPLSKLSNLLEGSDEMRKKTMKELIIGVLRSKKRMTAKAILSNINSNRKKTFTLQYVKLNCYELVRAGKLISEKENSYVFYKLKKNGI